MTITHVLEQYTTSLHKLNYSFQHYGGASEGRDELFFCRRAEKPIVLLWIFSPAGAPGDQDMNPQATNPISSQLAGKHQ